MNDRMNIVPRTVNPEMKPVGRIDHALALEHIEIIIHEKEITRSKFFEAETETSSPHSPRFLAARSDLAGETRTMILMGKDARCQR